jgi:hypothetical protein
MVLHYFHDYILVHVNTFKNKIWQSTFENMKVMYIPSCGGGIKNYLELNLHEYVHLLNYDYTFWL